jgi:predicted DNA-binding protein (MmcQ/YjbR family)
LPTRLGGTRLSVRSDERASSTPAGAGLKRHNMTYAQFNTFCRALPATTYVVQWGGSHVWKVGGKVFAIASRKSAGGKSASGKIVSAKDQTSVTFKVSPIAYEMLKEQPGLRPAPYLASRGMKWIQHFAKPGLSDAALRDYIRQSHLIVSQALSRKRRIELGLGMS